MDPLERKPNQTSQQRAMQLAMRADLWTAMPAIVVSYDAEKMTVVAQVSIMAQQRTEAGEWKNVTIANCPDVPVCFPAGGGFLATFPLQPGDEGILVFAARCIDSWWQSGGVQPPAELRYQDLSDGMFVPGLFSQPRVPAPAPSTAAMELRTADGETLVRLTADTVRIEADFVTIHARKVLRTDALGVGSKIDGVTPRIDTYTDTVPTFNHLPDPPEIP